MAYIDKTYITSYQQAVDYVNWSKENKLVYNGRVMNPIPYYSLEEYKEHFSSNEKEIAFLNTSLSEDYFLIKYCPLDFIQERMKEIYDEDYYNSIKNGTSHFDTFDRNSITGNKVKCIKESNFANKYDLKGFFTSMFISNEKELIECGFKTFENCEVEMSKQNRRFSLGVNILLYLNKPISEWIEYLTNSLDKDEKDFVCYNYEALCALK